MSALAKRIVTNLFSQAGITIGGNNYWDIRVNNDRFYPSTLRGSLGFGESYMKGDWEVESIDALFRRIIRMDITHSSLVTLNRLYLDIKSRLTNLQTRIGSLAIGDGVARVDRPMYFVSLVCRKKKDARVLWIDRTLVGNVPVKFMRQQWDRTDDERCVRIQDLIREDTVGWGDFEYHVSVYDDPSLEAEPIITRVRKFTAVDPNSSME